MLTTILILLGILWLFGYLSFPLTNIVVFYLLGRAITFNNLLQFALILWLLNFLPYPFRNFAAVILILWLLSILGIIAVGNFSNIILLVLIIGLVFYLFSWK